MTARMRNCIFPRVLLPAALGVLAAFLAAPISAAAGEQYDPLAVYLTWRQDPATTMTVHWHTFKEEDRDSVVEYRVKEDEDAEWATAPGESEPFPFSYATWPDREPTPKRIIHTVELVDLEPDTDYQFRFDDPESKVYKFRTMPEELDRPVRFATGGDLHYAGDTFGKMNRAAAKFNIDFVVWGDDLAYGDADPRQIDRWYTFFEVAKETLINPDGRMIPMIVGIGNHEIFSSGRLESLGEELASELGLEVGDAPFFFPLFAWPGDPPYGVLDFGDYLSLIILDTGHYVDIEVPQTDWLASVLAPRQDVPHVFPVYHVPGYPSFRVWTWTENATIRQNWFPLFEEYGVRLVFENHDHTYKRTHPLLRGEIVDDGIVYLGDGAWGVNPREPASRQDEGGNYWYLANYGSINHGFIVTLYEDQRHVLAIDNEGNVFDEVYQRLD